MTNLVITDNILLLVIIGLAALSVGIVVYATSETRKARLKKGYII